MDGSPEGDLARLILLVLAAAFFSGSEAAFLALSRTRVRQMQERGLFGSGLLLVQHRHRAVVLSVVILGITLCNYMAERVATVASVAQFGPHAGPIVAIAIMTIVIVVFGEVIPIQLGAAMPERVGRIAAVLIAPIAIILLPLVLTLSFISRALLYVLGVRPRQMLPGVSEEHLKAMIEQSEEQGVVDAGERRMMHGVLDFGDRTAAQIMTPRPDMIGVDAQQTLAEALRLGLEEHHSRLPVYEDTPDHIIGVLHLKDLLPYLIKGEMDRPVRRVARCAHHVPETLRADELLHQLQSRRQMLAVVKDEYGGTAGVVTVEDLLEEIVGEIVDEYDVEEPEIVELSPTELLCDARVGLHELEPYVVGELPTEEYESLAGVVLDLAGRVPGPGETFEWRGLRLTVEAVNGPRLEKIRVGLLPEPAWDEGEEEQGE
ncbi:hemolysin family protein [bacterium]|nr:hemolysin family protein [bacterium]